MSTTTTLLRSGGAQVECYENPPARSAERTEPTEPAVEAPSPSPASDRPQPRDQPILWHYVIGFTFLHVFAVYAFVVLLTGRVHFKTLSFAAALFCCAILGITAGAHRLWSHRSFKARLPLRVLLVAFQTLAYQFNVFQWVRDHRVHHKCTDTDADPYNSSRGFFFAHVGWLFVQKHPDFRAEALKVDMRDVMADPVVQWQRKYYTLLTPTVSLLIPTLIPYWFWDERFLDSFAVTSLRHVLALHVVFLINSAAHMWGMKPYDVNITPTENPMVSLLVFGEGWHNYHHSFPWDYKAAELGNYRLNLTTAFIDGCALLGLAYDLKTADSGLVVKRSRRTGDGTKFAEE